MERTGIEPATPSLQSRGMPDVTADITDVTNADANACTGACTNSPNSDQSDTLERLADALRALTADERTKLTELLKSGDKSAAG